MEELLQARLLNILHAPPPQRAPEQPQSHLYALVDAARDPAIASRIQGLASNVRLLMQGEDLEEFGDEAPWLVELKAEERLLQWLLDAGWGKRWLVFLESTLSLNVLLAHLQRFISVLDEHGEEMYFRFYDPFILLSYLPVFSREQRALLFSKIQSVVLEIGEKAFIAMDYPQDEAGSIHKAIIELTHSGIETTEGVFSLPNLDPGGARTEPLVGFSKQQLELPILANRALLIEHLEEYLREHHDKQMSCFAKGLVHAMINHGVELAFSFQIFDLVYVRMFCALMWSIAPGFHKEPSIHAVLAQSELSAEARFERLAEDRFAAAWMSADGYDDSREWLAEKDWGNS